VAMVSRIASSWVPSAARFRRAVARSRVMVGCWFVVWKGKGVGPLRRVLPQSPQRERPFRRS
jgi:hypothetical protein